MPVKTFKVTLGALAALFLVLFVLPLVIACVEAAVSWIFSR